MAVPNEGVQKRQNRSVPGPLDKAWPANNQNENADLWRLMLGERDAYVASHGSRALGVAICDSVLRNVAISLLDVAVKESSR